MAKVAMPQEMKGVPLEVLADEDRAKLNDSDFGLVILTKQANVLRKFPVNDPGNASDLNEFLFVDLQRSNRAFLRRLLPPNELPEIG